MGFENRLDHFLLRHFIGSGLDHDHLFPGRGHGQLKVGNLFLSQGGVNDEFSVDQSHLCGGAGAVKGNVGNAGGDGRSQHGRNLRIALRIH